METVTRLLQKKGHTVWTVTPEMSVYEALKLMADKNIGAVMVLEDDQVVGIMTERDYARKVILHDKSSKTTAVREIMSPCVLYIHPNQRIDECMALMNAKRVRHLPVIENNQLVGIISIRDVVQDIIEEQGFIIGQLENYVHDYRDWSGPIATEEVVA